MPTKRTRVTRTPTQRITMEAVAAFEAGDRAALHRELRLKPWQVSPLDVDDGPSPWRAHTSGATSWPGAQELRRELMGGRS